MVQQKRGLVLVWESQPGNTLTSAYLIATPTKLDVWSSSTERATPNPEKNAMGIPAKNVVLVPRLSISFVGLEVIIQKCCQNKYMIGKYLVKHSGVQ